MITIRTATPADATLLAKIGEETFFDTFSSQNTPKNMERYLKASFSPALQAYELAEMGAVFMIAEMEGETAGYAKLLVGSREPGIKGEKPVELVRIYTRKKVFGQGVGAALMQACLTEAIRLGGDVIWLGVWEHNPRAIRFYQKWGFEKVGTHAFLLGDDLQTDWIMQRALIF
ncbi:MAG: GNAT family N-acetyltransferase [Anaerolineales bacterium]|nr:GNAT family N-acetyltransferase [Anaerolineales bacterium]